MDQVRQLYSAIGQSSAGSCHAIRAFSVPLPLHLTLLVYRQRVRGDQTLNQARMNDRVRTRARNGTSDRTSDPVSERVNGSVPERVLERVTNE